LGLFQPQVTFFPESVRKQLLFSPAAANLGLDVFFFEGQERQLHLTVIAPSVLKQKNKA
jgi:hypothetical protein